MSAQLSVILDSQSEKVGEKLDKTIHIFLNFIHHFCQLFNLIFRSVR